MSKLVESTFVTLDGVISNPQTWSLPYWDEEHALDGIATTHLRLVDTTRFSSGIVVLTYAHK